MNKNVWVDARTFTSYLCSNSCKLHELLVDIILRILNELNTEKQSFASDFNSNSFDISKWKMMCSTCGNSNICKIPGIKPKTKIASSLIYGGKTRCEEIK
jgi:hypothetical protein